MNYAQQREMPKINPIRCFAKEASYLLRYMRHFHRRKTEYGSCESDQIAMFNARPAGCDDGRKHHAGESCDGHEPSDDCMWASSD
jgi:hypothetical protein